MGDERDGGETAQTSIKREVERETEWGMGKLGNPQRSFYNWRRRLPVVSLRDRVPV